MGRVYLARHGPTGAMRALKVLEGPEDPEAVVRFKREAEALARVSAGVVRVHELAREGPRLGIALELMQGSLRGRLTERGRLEWREGVALAAKLARTLERCHAAGLVHRDLKPDNVLFDERGEPKLADFGCVRDLRASRLTETGTVLGTVAYMSPEQLNGEPVCARTDVWALGVLLHEVLTGTRPFAGRTPFQVFASIRARGPVAVAAKLGAPPELDLVLSGALTVERAARTPTAGELASRLERLLDPRKAREPRRAPVAAAALVLVVLVGLGVVTLRLAHSEGSGARSPAASSAPRDHPAGSSLEQGPQGARVSAHELRAAASSGPALLEALARRAMDSGIEPEAVPILVEIAAVRTDLPASLVDLRRASAAAARLATDLAAVSSSLGEPEPFSRAVAGAEAATLALSKQGGPWGRVVVAYVMDPLRRLARDVFDFGTDRLRRNTAGEIDRALRPLHELVAGSSGPDLALVRASLLLLSGIDPEVPWSRRDFVRHANLASELDDLPLAAALASVVASRATDDGAVSLAEASTIASVTRTLVERIADRRSAAPDPGDEADRELPFQKRAASLSLRSSRRLLLDRAFRTTGGERRSLLEAWYADRRHVRDLMTRLGESVLAELEDEISVAFALHEPRSEIESLARELDSRGKRGLVAAALRAREGDAEGAHHALIALRREGLEPLEFVESWELDAWCSSDPAERASRLRHRDAKMNELEASRFDMTVCIFGATVGEVRHGASCRDAP